MNSPEQSFIPSELDDSALVRSYDFLTVEGEAIGKASCFIAVFEGKAGVATNIGNEEG